MTDEMKRKPSEGTPDQEEIKEQARIGSEIMKEYAETLRALAKVSPKDEKSKIETVSATSVKGPRRDWPGRLGPGQSGYKAQL
jgi:hypothetical protein